MKEKDTVVEVDKLPKCNICKRSGVSRDAVYDGKMKTGPWAYMCRAHFAEFGAGLGLGRGQELVKVKKKGKES